MIRLHSHARPFPRPESGEPRLNAWGTQWRHLPRVAKQLVRNSQLDALRKL